MFLLAKNCSPDTEFSTLTSTILYLYIKCRFNWGYMMSSINMCGTSKKTISIASFVLFGNGDFCLDSGSYVNIHVSSAVITLFKRKSSPTIRFNIHEKTDVIALITFRMSFSSVELKHDLIQVLTHCTWTISRVLPKHNSRPSIACVYCYWGISRV